MFSTGTMIDILTTRFHDAYSYLVTENGNLIKDKHTITTPIKHRHEDFFAKQRQNSVNTVTTTPLKDEDQSNVINYFHYYYVTISIS